MCEIITLLLLNRVRFGGNAGVKVGGSRIILRLDSVPPLIMWPKDNHLQWPKVFLSFVEKKKKNIGYSPVAAQSLLIFCGKEIKKSFPRLD